MPAAAAIQFWFETFVWDKVFFMILFVFSLKCLLDFFIFVCFLTLCTTGIRYPVRFRLIMSVICMLSKLKLFGGL